MNAPAQMMVFEIPQDGEWLAAWAAVSLRHAQLDHSLRMTVKTLANLEVHEGLDATEGDGSAYLRGVIKKLARHRLGESEAFLRLRAILTRCGRLTERRNELVHGIVGRGLDGDEHRMRGRDGQWQQLPTAAELQVLAGKVLNITVELNHARLAGFLALALRERDVPRAD